MITPESFHNIEKEVKEYHRKFWEGTPVSKHYRQVVEETGELGQALIDLEVYRANNDFARDEEIDKLRKKVAVECADVAITLMAVLIETDPFASLYKEVYEKLLIIRNRQKNHKAEAYNNMKVLGEMLCLSEDANFQMICDKIQDLLYTSSQNDLGKTNADL